MKKQNSNLIFISWIVAMIATVGSLFFSVIMEFTPCSLCWYQRVAMYPLAIIFLFGVYDEEHYCMKTSIPFTVIGWAIAVYHNLLQWEIIPESASPCLNGVPCSAKWINWFGFISIPFLSLMAFTILLITLVIYYKNKKSMRTTNE
ncbi:disulfide oxidoreductase [Halobacteriovorax sp. YZS-1-1]|uniref:disulfide oxidoreductase n=1 Tax=unclassified Halobacteriovorax TaxID=2639665 RepID=UPI0039998DEE